MSTFKERMDEMFPDGWNQIFVDIQARKNDIYYQVCVYPGDNKESQSVSIMDVLGYSGNLEPTIVDGWNILTLNRISRATSKGVDVAAFLRDFLSQYLTWLHHPRAMYDILVNTQRLSVTSPGSMQYPPIAIKSDDGITTLNKLFGTPSDMGGSDISQWKKLFPLNLEITIFNPVEATPAHHEDSKDMPARPEDHAEEQDVPQDPQE